jgi:hypothetical protein
MGGFVTRDGHHPIVIRKEPQISQYLGKIEQIKEEDIKDRSKADGLANFLKLTQVVWFTVHCVARLMEGLPVSQLETATTAYTAFHIVIWISWRKKPLDVSEAILIDFVSPN